ncbi:MAG: hypothetical protein C5B45_06610 [Chlamydiae bacterium]|nr:MAG: hypothetical protein C5B45_06610 [Chlamydiota bacterium]
MTTYLIANPCCVDVYPSAFQWIEKPLYYLNEEKNKPISSKNDDKQSSRISFGKFLAIQYLVWPMIMCAAPLTASVDIGVGICEAFYAKYKGATSHQIILIIQKKILASPIQHLAYIITNLFFPFFAGTALALASFQPSSIIPLVGFFLVILSPPMALLNYHLAQQFIGQKLPAWARPEGFNIFINGGCLDPGGNKITDEDYNEEARFHEWKRKQMNEFTRENHKESLYTKLRDKAFIVHAYQNNEFKNFFYMFLNKTSTRELLQLNPSFSDKELRKAFRKWSLVLHPDKHSEESIKKVAETLFKEVLYPARLELEKELQKYF